MATLPDDIDTKILMQGVHIELTEAMKNAIREKFSRLLRHNEWIIRINVRLHQDQKLGHEYHYTATAQIEIGGPDIVASVDGKEAYDVIDGLVDKLDKLLARRHGLRKEKRKHPHEIDLDATLPKVEEAPAE